MNEKGIAPSQKEETLTPRCPRTKAYRAVAKRRSAYAAMPSHKSVSRRREKKERLRRDDYTD